MSMQQRNIEKLVDQTINSFDGAERATPKPFLLTRVMAAINERNTGKNPWALAGAFLSRPGIAVAGLACILFVNISVFVLSKNSKKPLSVPNNSVIVDDFAANAANMYDLENLEAQ